MAVVIRAFGGGTFGSGTFGGSGLEPVGNEVLPSGIAATYLSAPPAGFVYKFVNDTGKNVIHLRNGGPVTVNLTVYLARSLFDGLAVANLIVAVPAGQQKFIGPFPPYLFSGSMQGGSNRIVAFSVDQSTSVSFAVLHI